MIRSTILPSRTSLRLLVLAAFAVSTRAADARALEPLVTNFGLGHILHPMEQVSALPYPPGFVDRCCCRKDQVHIFGVNGLNPLCTGNFNGFCTFFREHGFSRTTFDQLYTCDDIPTRIRRIRALDPDARIVLIGFSLGCNSVRSIANELAEQNVKIDLMVYMVGDFIQNDAYSRPPNVARILNIRAKGLVLSGGDFFFNGADLDGARNEKLTHRHILVPSRRETLDLCMQEVLALMCRPCAAK